MRNYVVDGMRDGRSLRWMELQMVVVWHGWNERWQ